MESPKENKMVADMETIDILSKGILEVYEQPLMVIKDNLKELTDQQESVQSMLTEERRLLEAAQSNAIIDSLLANVASNRERLLHISNSMTSLHKRVTNLQSRAERVCETAKAQNNTTRNNLA